MLPITVSRDGSTSLPAQLIAEIHRLVHEGILAPGDPLPSTRELARTLGISRGSVTTAYEQLAAEGYVLSSQGAPTRIHPDLLPPTHSPALPPAASRRRTPVLSLAPSSAHAGQLRPTAWRAAWREAASQPVTPLAAAGEPELRHAIAEHLRVARATPTDVDNVLVTGGSREGLLLILTALGSHQLRVGVEDPGQPSLRRIITMLGHELVLCPIDQHGIDPAQLPCDLDALLVTPTHQYPIGGPLPAPRRAALLAWAQRTATIIIEDDYCAELRYRTAPQPTLHALSAHTGSATVIVLGTFSTLLSPALSTGYVIAQPQLTNRLLDARSVLGMPAAQVTQRAIAHLLSGGYVRKHTKSVHSTLRTRARIIDSQLLPTLHAAGISTRHAGVDYLLSFPTPAHQAKFDAALSRNNLSCQHVEDTAKRVISFAHLSDADFHRAMGVIMNALD